jgi:hypothetical protein
MAELADALASGASGRKVVGVQVPLRARKTKEHPARGVSFCTNRKVDWHCASWQNYREVLECKLVGHSKNLESANGGQ